MKTHRNLDVWIDAMDLVVDIYNVTKQFPKEEIFCLTSQIRRAVVSVAANISEGAGRNSSKELRRFLYFSFGSLSELETLLIIGNRLGYLDNATWTDLFPRIKKMTSL